MGEVCQTTFPAPAELEEVVTRLDEHHEGYINVMCKDGRIIGEWPYRLPKQGEPSKFLWVSTGDQCMFKANTVSEATAFLQGILIAVEHWK